MTATDFATFYALVALVLFFGVIVYFGVPKMITKTLDARGKRIEDELADAVRLRQEAQALLAEYAQKGAEAEREAATIIAAARLEAERLTAETAKSLEELIARRTRSAEAKIAQAETQAITEVRSRAIEIAISASEAILKQKVTGDAAADLISRSIADVRAKLN
ncbi:MAG: ATP F0F1 synthase subunit B [Ancalomicrobiaceae bacterium]|nr:ATP F0F1 synthase subunit B [Ancalomicrobiaceae bacterium]